MSGPHPGERHRPGTDDPDADGPDPFAPPATSPRGRRVLAVVALACALVAVPVGLPMLLGPLAMALGVVAHVKGDRFGMPATVLGGIATVVGMAVLMFLD